MSPNNFGSLNAPNATAGLQPPAPPPAAERRKLSGLLTVACLLLFLCPPELDAQVEPVLLSSACFDSLPYGAIHHCTAILEWRSAEPLDTLRARLQSALVHDSAAIALRHLGKTSLVFAIDAQPPKGCCRHGFEADSIEALARLRFDAGRKRSATVATLAIEGRGRIYQGGSRHPLLLVLCYMAHYSAALGVSPPQKDD
jgi:hypothetical protein